MYPKLFFALPALLILSLLGFGQSVRTTCMVQVEVEIDSQFIVASVPLKNGVMHGEYVAKYRDSDQFRSSGYLDHTGRVGAWKVHDVPQQDRPVALGDGPTGDGGYWWTFAGYDSGVKAEDITWDNRLFRRLEPEQNPILFEENRLFNALVDHIENDSLDMYQTDFFVKKVEQLPENLSELEVVAYRLEEEWFMTEKDGFFNGIVALCPMVKTADGEKELFWVYFPHARTMLEHDPVPTSKNGDPSNLQTVLDYRAFVGPIYKYGCLHSHFDEFLSPSEILEEQLKLEVEVIERYHQFVIDQLASNSKD